MVKKFEVNGVALIGLPGVGKTTGAKFLSTYGFSYVSASDVIREMCVAQSVDPTRENMLKIGAYFLETKGSIEFGNLLLKRIPKSADRVVFDGIRPIDTIQYLGKKLRQFVVLRISVSIECIKSRTSGDSKYKNYNNIINHPVERMVFDVHNGLREHEVVNNGSLQMYQQSLLDMVKKYEL